MAPTPVKRRGRWPDRNLPQLGHRDRYHRGSVPLDEAQTQTLIERGFEPSTIPSSDTGQETETLLAIPQDHMTVIDAIYSEVQTGRSISRSAIRQLHQVIIAHQPTFRAMNQFGQWFDARLEAGAFKRMPNNPTRHDGVIHQYCPPEHVDYARQSGAHKSTDDPSGRRRTHGVLAQFEIGYQDFRKSQVVAIPRP